MMTLKALPTATTWAKDRVKQWAPFEEVKRDSTHVFVRGLTRKPNGEEWIGWLPLDQVEVG